MIDELNCNELQLVTLYKGLTIDNQSTMVSIASTTCLEIVKQGLYQSLS